MRYFTTLRIPVLQSVSKDSVPVAAHEACKCWPLVADESCRR
jgi:hypothetical protein